MSNIMTKISSLIDEISMGPFGSDIKVDNFVPFGVPVLNGSNLTRNRLVEDGFKYVTEQKASTFKKAIARRGDIVITHRGTLGQISFIPDDSKFDTYVISQSQFRVRLKRDLVDPSFFVYYFHTSEGQKRLLANKCHVGVPALAQATTNFKLIEIPLPKIDIQQKIAAVLSALDAKIDLNNRINTELEAMAKTLYDYWFVQFDFPDKNGKPYKSSGGKMVWNKELKREIPVGWGTGIAADLFIFNPSLSFSKDAIGSYIDMSALPTSGFMTDEVQQKAFNGGVKFQNGDVVVARITPCLENGKTGLITLLAKDEIGFGSTEFIVLRGKRLPLSSFAACLSRSELFRKFAIANMTGTSGRKRIEAKTLETFGMPLPADRLLSKFEETVSPYFKATTVNTKQNQHLSSLRDWLLPMLMNGQVKVS